MDRHLTLIGVYETADDARAAAHIAARAGAHNIRLDEPLDHISAVESQMRTPQAEPVVKGMGIGVAIGAVIGMVVALPFAAITFGDLTTSSRLLVMAIVGAIVGSVAGWILATAWASRRAEEELAGERGATLAVDSSPVVEAALLATEPLRLDEVDEIGEPTRNVVARRPERATRRLGRHLADEHKRG